MQYDVERILLELELLPEFDDQICLQTVKGETDPFYGSRRFTDVSHTEEEFNVLLFDIPYINSILEQEGMYRSRVMRMSPKTCLTYHSDPTKRKHIPLVTNDNCFLIVEDQVLRLPADGNAYLVDTTKMHTAVNASFEYRIHIVGCVGN